MTDPALNNGPIADLVSPEILAFLEDNQPATDTSPDFQLGHWMGVTATVLAMVAEMGSELAEARQRIRELEADA